VVDRNDQSKHDKIELTERAIDRTMQRTVADLKRGLGGLGTIGSSAPFVVCSDGSRHYQRFELMAAKGSGGLATVSAGISEALITTPSVCWSPFPRSPYSNYFTNTIDQIVVDISDASGELLAYLTKKVAEEHTAS